MMSTLIPISVHFISYVWPIYFLFPSTLFSTYVHFNSYFRPLYFLRMSNLIVISVHFFPIYAQFTSNFCPL